MAIGRIVVTGGSGFLGGALAKALCRDGHEVIALSRRTNPELDSLGVRSYSVDLTKDPRSYQELFNGVEAVFHVAAKVDMWGPYQEFFAANVLATRNLLELCRLKNVPKFIFTSSPSVIADGTNLRGVDESYPYPKIYEANYPRTKAMAEREVLGANDGSLATIALRPHLIWGPGDSHLIPTIVERARRGRLIGVGDGNNLVDLTYIDDCVQAHLLALRALDSNPAARGRAFFISQGEPVKLWEWIDEILKQHGLSPIAKWVSLHRALLIARAAELWSRLQGSRSQPLLTRFLVREMATDHYFDISAARRELGYVPRYSAEPSEHNPEIPGCAARAW